MMAETYIALADCARRRIDAEWQCTAAESAALQLITELSFDLGQTWALVPCLADFAAVLGVHKSTVSRALRTALKKGYLLVLRRRDEMLYSVCTETRGEIAATATDASQIKARLVEVNKNRRAGTADADGQQRLPGVLPSEEIEAPARAFSAILEETADEPQNLPRGTIEATPTRASTDVHDDESNSDFQARLESMVRAAEKRREEVTHQGRGTSLTPQPTSREAQSLDHAMASLLRGLKPDIKHVMERLREEFQSAGKLQEANFFKWGRLWRKRAMTWPRQCLEAAGEHKNLRKTTGTAADEPGAWIYRALQDLTAVGNDQVEARRE